MIWDSALISRRPCPFLTMLLAMLIVHGCVATFEAAANAQEAKKGVSEQPLEKKIESGNKSANANRISGPGNKAKAGNSETQLTDGLLDLLDEPSNEPEMDSLPSSPPIDGDFTPGDVGLDGEDLGEASSNPLRAVRQSMMIAAGYLERGVTDRSTQVLQGDIVQRLDELIEEIESSNQNSPKQSQSSDSQQSEREQSSSFEKREREVTASEQVPDEDEAEQNLQKGSPGQTGVGAKVVEALKDPQELQEAVWGQLPERVRKRMQSRMVEQFLPSYREQIEAYYRSLLKEPR
ncbi:MAG: hypothetical protein ACE361_23900 [Aureliella sp.]